MNEFNNFRKVEVIDGVTCIHTGITRDEHRGYRRKYLYEGGGWEDLGYREVEIIEMYDSAGNRFYSNAETFEAAQEYIAELADIGPKAPWKEKNGGLIPNLSETEVGVFIVEQAEKKTRLYR